MKRFAFLIVAAACLHAGNLVVNPSFEDPIFFNGWTVTNAADGSDLTVVTEVSPAPDGTSVARFGGTTLGDYDQISQVLSTVNGQQYTLSFFFGDVGGGPGGEAEAPIRRDDPSLPLLDFQAIWDGSTIFDSQGGSTTFTQFSFTVTGTGSDTLQFIGYNQPSFSFLDEVSVDTAAATPEPASFVLIGVGLATLGMIRRRR